ncbi:hypothetical protein B0O99DRAFT_748056 [Bisporella sp. PMI_857]|nr:hypothetical protein B0O99DRAFT_748056 [Bisporella sp. PMI_857]
MEGDHTQPPNILAQNANSIAIIGLSCRFPGESSSPVKLWKACSEAKDCWSEVPKNRYNINGFYNFDGDRKGTVQAPRRSYFLKEDVFEFDSAFFGITPAEANAMDPQQRLLLECVYEALENAGVPVSKISGTATKVYVGSFNRDYKDELQRDSEQMPTYYMTGTEQSILANRISHSFNLHGPSVMVDTACSASLTALHLACQSIKTGESDYAIVGGSNLILNPHLTIGLARLGFMSSDSRSFAFDNRANGYARGESIACLLLKPAKAAFASSDPIRAIIRSSGVNQDGLTSSLTVPNSAAHESLIRDVYLKAGLNPKNTTYVEAHGTGTPTGDPIEAAAIYHSFVDGKERKYPLYIGSVKTNLGHLGGASGLAGVIKTVLMLERGLILPNMNFQNPNKDISFHNWRLAVPERMIPWPENQQKLRKVLASRQLVFIVTAKNKTSLLAYCQALADYLDLWGEAKSPANLLNLAFTLGEHRSFFTFKHTISASTSYKLAQSLRQCPENLARSVESPQLAFVFTGQGAQWYAMGRELISTYSVYRDSIQNLDRHVKQLGSPWSLIRELLRDQADSQVNQPHISQPLCTAIQIALVDLFRSWGILPTSVVGHSSGEIAAAYCASAIDEVTAMKIAYHRGIVAQELQKEHPALKGSMLAVGASVADVEPELERLKTGKVVIACLNADNMITASGDSVAVEELQASLEQKGCFARRLAIQVAYYSHHMYNVESLYRGLLGTTKTQKTSTVKFWSSVTSKKLDTENLTSDYWVRNLISVVKFAPALRNLCAASGKNKQSTVSLTLVEVGPHSALSAPINSMTNATTEDSIQDIRYIPSLVRAQDAVISLQTTAGRLFTRGHAINISAINAISKDEYPEVLVDLPPYSWNHEKRYLHSTRYSQDFLQRSEKRSEFLGVRTADSTSFKPRWRSIVSVSEMPWTRNHVILSEILYPAAGFLAMAVEGSKRLAEERGYSPVAYILREVHIVQALIVPLEGSTEVSVSFHPHSRTHRSRAGDWEEFRIQSHNPNTGWIEHCRGLVSTVDKPKDNPVNGRRNILDVIKTYQEKAADATARCKHDISIPDFYHQLSSKSMKYGDSFASIVRIRTTRGISLSDVIVPFEASPDAGESRPSYVFHPGTLDACFQTAMIALVGRVSEMKKPFLPHLIKELRLSANFKNVPSARFSVQTEASLLGGRKVSASIFSIDDTWTEEPVLSITGLIGTLLEPDTTLDKSNFVSNHTVCKTVWDIDVDLLDSFGPLVEKYDISQYNEVDAQNLKALEIAAINYIRDALDYLESRSATPSSNHLTMLFNWMHDELSKTPRTELMHGQSKNTLYHQVASMGQKGALLTLIGPQLGKIVQGDVDALSLMTGNEMLNEYYYKQKALFSANKAVASFVRTMSHKNPTLRILEIGAGTGATTKSILEGFGGINKQHAKFESYMFTDIGLSFLDLARHIFSDWGDLVEFRKLDIEVGPSIQGFVPNSYDIVIASNVLHATSEIKTTLSNVKDLLKPGGKLIVVEVVQKLRHLQVVFGTLSGWWASMDENRQGGPLMAKNDWNMAFIEAGFSGIDFTHDNSNVLSQVYQSVMVTTANQDLLSLASNDARNNAVDILYYGFDIRPQADVLKTKMASMTQHVPSIMALESAIITDTSYVLLINRLFLCQPAPELYLKLQVLCVTARSILCVFYISTDAQARIEAEFIVGLIRSVRAENPAIHVVTLELNGPREDLDSANELITKVLQASAKKHDPSTGGEFEYIENDGIINIPRVVWDQRLNDKVNADRGQSIFTQQGYDDDNKFMHLSVNTPGSLDSLYFTESSDGLEGLAEDSIELEVRVAGVNFRDVMVSAGQLEPVKLGVECSGLVTAIGCKVTRFKVGDRIFGLAKNTFAHSLRCPAATLQLIPENITFEEAASLPVIYCTVIYALEHVARVQRGEIILIHSGAGGVGQAAIMLCQYLGLRVLVTVGSLEKKKFLIEQYSIPEANILFSRDARFVEDILRLTAGRGVDVVLNSLAADLLRVSWNCVAMFGRFIEIGKHDISLNVGLEMQNFHKNTTFASVDLMKLRDFRAEQIQGCFSRMLDLLKQKAVGFVQPLNIVRFPEIEGAFRALQNGRQWGKWIAVPNLDDTLKDSLFEKMKFENFLEVIRPKVNGTWNLHNSFKTTELDFFTILSSCVGVVGNRAQAAYAGASASQDSFSEYRRQLGLPCMSVDLGVIEDIGYVAENQHLQPQLGQILRGISAEEFLRLVHLSIYEQKRPDHGHALITGLRQQNDITLSDAVQFWWIDRRFAHLKASILVGNLHAATKKRTEVSLRQLISKRTTFDEASNITYEHLSQKVASILGLNTEDLQRNKSLRDYGLDSLATIELRGWAYREIDSSVKMFDLQSDQLIGILASTILRMSKFAQNLRTQ